MSDTVFDYFKSQLATVPSDITLRDLSCDSECGRDCCDVIDRTQSLMSICDPTVHLDLIEAAAHAISIKWHG